MRDTPYAPTRPGTRQSNAGLLPFLEDKRIPLEDGKIRCLVRFRYDLIHSRNVGTH